MYSCCWLNCGLLSTSYEELVDHGSGVHFLNEKSLIDIQIQIDFVLDFEKKLKTEKQKLRADAHLQFHGSHSVSIDNVLNISKMENDLQLHKDILSRMLSHLFLHTIAKRNMEGGSVTVENVTPDHIDTGKQSVYESTIHIEDNSNELNYEWPNLTFTQLVIKALSQSQNKEMRRMEITSWIRNEYAYFNKLPLLSVANGVSLALTRSKDKFERTAQCRWRLR